MDYKYLEAYYNKFCEDKRLLSRHGQVEFLTTIRYIEKYINGDLNKKIFDDGAGTGRYSLYFKDKGYDVTSIELIKNNLGVLKSKSKDIKAYLGNALDLSRFKEEYDIVLIFGPMYHLFSLEEKKKVLQEAYKITKKNGYIFISYILEDYAILKHGFIDNNIVSSIKDDKVDDNFKIHHSEKDIYDYVSLDEINNIATFDGLKRVQIIAQDGPTDFFRKEINNMSDEVFKLYLKYHFSRCEKTELLGASSHVLDILQKIK